MDVRGVVAAVLADAAFHVEADRWVHRVADGGHLLLLFLVLPALALRLLLAFADHGTGTRAVVELKGCSTRAATFGHNSR